MVIPFIAACLFFQTSFGVPAKYLKSKPEPGAILATVGGQAITTTDVESLLWEWRTKEVTEELITSVMLRNEAQKLGVIVKPEEVEAEAKRQIDQLAGTLAPGVSVADALAEQGSAPSRVYLRVRNKLMLDAICLRTLVPSEYIKVSTMVFRPASEQTSALTAAIKRADTAYSRLVRGEVWDQVLRDNTTDSDVLKSQGLIGWRRLSAFPEVVSKEMQGMKVGGLTKPAQTVNGFQIFRIEAFGKEATGKELDSLRDQYLAASRPDVFERIKKEAQIVRK